MKKRVHLKQICFVRHIDVQYVKSQVGMESSIIWLYLCKKNIQNVNTKEVFKALYLI